MIAVLLASAVPVLAQGAGDVGGFTRFGSYPTFEPYEHFDTQSLRMLLRFTDLELPGNRGRVLRFQRTFSTVGTWTVTDWSWGPAGIPVAVAEGVRPLESLVDIFSKGPKLYMGDGGVRQLYYEELPNLVTPNAGDPEYRYSISTDRLRYDAVNQIVRIPDGSTCEYDNVTGANPVVHRLTRCSDAYGPYLEVSYGTNLITYHQILGPSQERTVELQTIWQGQQQYQMTLRYVEMNRTWTLTRSSQVQTTFQGPEGSATWIFDQQQYASALDGYGWFYPLRRVTTPGGGGPDPIQWTVGLS